MLLNEYRKVDLCFSLAQALQTYHSMVFIVFPFSRHPNSFLLLRLSAENQRSSKSSAEILMEISLKRERKTFIFLIIEGDKRLGADLWDSFGF